LRLTASYHCEAHLDAVAIQNYNIDYHTSSQDANNDKKQIPISIHLADMPIPNKELIDLVLERRMDTAQKIVSIARFLREKSKIRIRQPLNKILIPISSIYERRDILQVENIIKEELNIKEIEFITDDTNIVSKTAKANFKTIGKKFGKDTQALANAIKELTNNQIKELEVNKNYNLYINNIYFTISIEDVEIVNNDIEGWLVATDNGITVALDTTLTEDLIQEGIAREFVSKIQNIRKETGLEVIDRITIDVDANDNIISAIKAKNDYICSETLCNVINPATLSATNEIEFIETKIKVLVKKM